MSRWLPIPGYVGLYEIAANGDVRSVKGGRQREKAWWKERKAGYRTVRLCRHGQAKTIPVHQLVAATFLPNRPPNSDVRHLNGDASDPRVENLEYSTRSVNIQDSVRHGTHFNASKTHCKHGHEFTDANTRIMKRGGRDCRACHRDRSRRNRQKMTTREVIS